MGFYMLFRLVVGSNRKVVELSNAVHLAQLSTLGSQAEKILRGY